MANTDPVSRDVPEDRCVLELLQHAEHLDKAHGPGLVLPDSHQGKAMTRACGVRVTSLSTALSGPVGRGREDQNSDLKTSCMDSGMS